MPLIRTPRFLDQFFYVAVDLHARVRDEAAAISIGRAYLGIYPTPTGFEVAYGILDQNGSLG